ncbi:hypothetical protein PLEOSDRAFT_153982 [Pleurotus ostreatus PC15]|uniref:Heterokaryon incompatibility domain-containing protein n=1 Tax=Pleurotus ostreatus (strain PC15) TaxID=1137138 RepID=A0A067P5U9_PLEO1|nr:hypothetical protein PLEOSDRAFT_153982 [Pleurotus ostreatus PC15]
MNGNSEVTLNTSGYSYITSWEEIEASAKTTGCNSCGLLNIYSSAAVAKTRAETGITTPPEQKIQLRYCIESQERGRPNELLLFIDSLKFGRFRICAEEGDDAADYIGRQDPLQKITPSVDYALCTKLIAACALHESCRPHQEVGLPTRLIDCSEPDNPRVVITAGQRGFYATLSYVWGGAQPQQLTKATLTAYIQRITTPLPQTIEDAIFVTHQLGLPYLWVDALCIIQDSDDDKLQELGHMHDIYEHEHVMLTPEFAYSAREGFLPERRPPMRLPFYTPIGRMGTMLLRAQASESLLAYESINTRVPIFTRAWCFQENTLAPRSVIFCFPEVYFRCRSTRAKVTEDANPSRDINSSDVSLLFPKALPEEGRMSLGLQSLWYRMVLDYSERLLSFPADKLNAIAGVAEAFHMAGAGEYLAGLWRSTLLEDLMWITSDHGSQPSARPEYRAPSWSWASANCQVHMHPWEDEAWDRRAEYRAEVVACTVSPISTKNPFGAVSGGVLTLRTKMEPIDWDPVACRVVKTDSHPKGLLGEQDRTHAIDETAAVTKEYQYQFVLLAAGYDMSYEGRWMKGLVVLSVGKDGAFTRVQAVDDYIVSVCYEAAPTRTISIV